MCIGIVKSCPHKRSVRNCLVASQCWCCDYEIRRGLPKKQHKISRGCLKKTRTKKQETHCLRSENKEHSRSPTLLFSHGMENLLLSCLQVSNPISCWCCLHTVAATPIVTSCSQVCTSSCCPVAPIFQGPQVFALLLSSLLLWVVVLLMMHVKACWGRMGLVGPCRLWICISTLQMWNGCHRMLGAWVWVGVLMPMSVWSSGGALDDAAIVALWGLLKLTQCFGIKASPACPLVVVQLLLPFLFGMLFLECCMQYCWESPVFWDQALCLLLLLLLGDAPGKAELRYVSNTCCCRAAAETFAVYALYCMCCKLWAGSRPWSGGVCR